MNENKIYCILDVNFNRIKEGLRVVEEYCRFYKKNKKCMEQIRSVRHELTLVIKGYYACLIKSRDVVQDEGRIIKEKNRESVEEIVISNIKRVEEGFRVLEEYSKVLSNKNIPKLFKKFRYTAYQIEQDLMAR